MGGEGDPPNGRSYVARGRAKRAQARGGLAVHRQGGAYSRWCTHKAVQIQGVLWPPHECCYFRGVWGLAPTLSEASQSKGEVWRSTHKAVHTQGGAHTRRCTHKAVCGHRRSVVI